VNAWRGFEKSGHVKLKFKKDGTLIKEIKKKNVSANSANAHVAAPPQRLNQTFKYTNKIRSRGCI